MAATAVAAAPVRVAFVSSHAHGGGSERYLELLLGELGPDWIAGVIALQEGPFADRLRDLGYEPVGSAPAQFAAHIKAELAKWTKVIKGAGIKAE